MKNFNFIKLMGFLCLLLILIGCNEPHNLTITTHVNTNGSLLRTITLSGDSTGVPETAYPLSRDASWEVKSEPDSADTASFNYTLRKYFSTAEELNKELGCRRDSIKVNDEVTLKKRFRWFFTYYRFEETLYSVNPFTLVPLEKYLTPEEISFFYAHKDTMDIDDKAEAWQTRSIFESYYQILQAAVSGQNTPLTTEQLELHKEALFKSSSEWKAFEELYSDVLLRSADSLFSPSFSMQALKGSFAQVDTALSQYFKFMIDSDEVYEFMVEMPGRIIDADTSGSIEQGKVSWKVETDDIEYRDVVMRVESRRFNKVPTVIFGLFILSLIMLLWISAVRARRRRWLAAGLIPAEFPRLLLKPWISVLCMAVGVGLVGFFGWLFRAFFTQPQFLNIFLLATRDRLLFLVLMALGMIFFTFGLVHLIRWYRRKLSDR